MPLPGGINLADKESVELFMEWAVRQKLSKLGIDAHVDSKVYMMEASHELVLEIVARVDNWNKAKNALLGVECEQVADGYKCVRVKGHMGGCVTAYGTRFQGIKT